MDFQHVGKIELCGSKVWGLYVKVKSNFLKTELQIEVIEFNGQVYCWKQISLN